jgi:predicted helicase
VLTARDGVVIDFDKETLMNRMEKFSDLSVSDQTTRAWLFPNKSPGKYEAGDSRGWKMTEARKAVAKQNIEGNILLIKYRPFDERYIYYVPEMIDWGRFDVMDNYKKNNVGLLFSRMTKGKDFAHVQVTNKISEVIYLSPLTGTNAFNAPLYLYNGDGTKSPNLKTEIVDNIEKSVGKVTPEEIFDYVYAILHSPSYRKTYQEFLKADFPKIPYPSDKNVFIRLVELGHELRLLHLLVSPKLNKLITTYPIAGSDTVEKIEYRNGNVYINSSQYIGNVPEVAWNLWVGGYQPAQKWLKDRKGKILTNEDIEHYQKIIVVMAETNRLMIEIAMVDKI